MERRKFGQTTARFRTISDVIDGLRLILGSKDRNLEGDPELIRAIEAVGIKINAEKPGPIEDIVERLEHLMATVEEEVLSRRIEEAFSTAEQDLRNARMPAAEMRALLEEYDRHLQAGLTPDEAARRVERESGRKITALLQRRYEIHQENVASGAKEGLIEKIVTDGRLELEIELEAAGVDKDAAEGIAEKIVKKTVLNKVLSDDIPKIAEQALGVVPQGDIRDYSREIVVQKFKDITAKIEVGPRIEKITIDLVDQIIQVKPNVTAEEEKGLREAVGKEVTEQVMGGNRLGEVSVDAAETDRGGVKGTPKLSELIIDNLDLPPSKVGLVEKAVSVASVAAMEEVNYGRAAESVVEALAQIPAVRDTVKARAAEITKVVKEEIQKSVADGNFETVAGKVAEKIDPDSRSGVAIGMAVEEEVARELQRWSPGKVEAITRVFVEMGPKAEAKMTEIEAAVVEENAARKADPRTVFSRIQKRVGAILEIPESDAPIVSAMARAEERSRQWDKAKADQVADRLVTVLKTDKTIAAKLSPREESFKSMIRPKMEAAVIEGLPLEESTTKKPLARNLTDRVVVLLGIPAEKIPMVRMAVKKAGKEVDWLIMSDRENIKIIRQEEIRNQIELGIVRANRGVVLTTNQMNAVHEFSGFVARFRGAESGIEPYKDEAVAFAEGRDLRPGVINNAWGDLANITKIVRMSPSQFKKFSDQYYRLKDGLGGLKVPFESPAIRSLDGVMRFIKDNPKVQHLLNFAQKFTGLSNSIGSFTNGLVKKIGLEKAGISVIEKIGGQAMGEFVRQSLVVIGQNGMRQGLTMILRGIIGGGVKAGSVVGGGTAGALAGAVAAFQAVPLVGQIILIGALAVVGIKKVIKPILDRFFKPIAGIIGNLGLNLGIKKFFQDKFGKGFGWLLGAGATLGVMIAAVPMAFAGWWAATMALMFSKVIVAVFIGIITFSLITSINVSAQVTRGPPSGVEVYDYGNEPWEIFVPNLPLPTRDPSIVIPESCPGIWPTDSGVVTQGPLGQWSHRGTQAIDISIISGSPIYATHDGLAFPGGGKGSGYGFYVDVMGVCNGVSIITRYAHMPRLIFTEQKLVKQGEIIGYVDNTGNSTGPHLHYELTGGQINDWLPKPVPLKCSHYYECLVSIP
ncbi:MAG: peptidoglycan DD-metalloendopeptidase family protein [Candidatus Shapirobacteria bacterium]|jgi:hypothetical protein